MYNNQRKALFELEAQGKAIVFEPNDTTNWSRTVKDPEIIKAMYDEGYALGMKRMQELEEYIK